MSARSLVLGGDSGALYTQLSFESEFRVGVRVVGATHVRGGAAHAGVGAALTTPDSNYAIANYITIPLPYPGSIDEVQFMQTNTSQDWETTSYNNEFNPGNIGSPGFYTVS